MPKKQKPIAAPSILLVQQAQKVLNEWWLHYYQLLYFQEPALTSPEGYPFHVRIPEQGKNTLQIMPQSHTNRDVAQYSFRIPPFLNGRTQEEVDLDVLNKCHIILEAIKNNLQKSDYRACCGLATPTNCVCAYSYECILHGGGHVGTHD